MAKNLTEKVALVTSGSRGIGAATAGMPHGETSCVMLPHILRYNAPVNAARQAVLAEAAGQGGRELADLIGDLVSSLELPLRLRDAGVGADEIEAVAAAAMHDRWLQTNPRPIPTEAEMLKLLQSAR